MNLNLVAQQITGKEDEVYDSDGEDFAEDALTWDPTKEG